MEDCLIDASQHQGVRGRSEHRHAEVEGWSQDQFGIVDVITSHVYRHQVAGAQGDAPLLQINRPRVQLCVVGCLNRPCFVTVLYAFPRVSVDGGEYEREFKRPYFFIRRLLTIQLFPCLAEECGVVDRFVIWFDELGQESRGQVLEPRVSPPVLE